MDPGTAAIHHRSIKSQSKSSGNRTAADCAQNLLTTLPKVSLLSTEYKLADKCVVHWSFRKSSYEKAQPVSRDKNIQEFRGIILFSVFLHPLLLIVPHCLGFTVLLCVVLRRVYRGAASEESAFVLVNANC